MKKIFAIIIVISMFLMQITVINAMEFINISGNYANIDLKNSMLYLSSAKIAAGDLEYMLNGDYTVCAYTDSTKSEVYEGYLTTGNFVTLVKENKSINLTVKKITPHNISESFNNIANGSKPYDFPTVSSGKYTSGGVQTGYSSVTYEAIGDTNTDKCAKMYMTDTAGVNKDMLIQSRGCGLTGPAVLSMDLLNATPQAGHIAVVIGNPGNTSSYTNLISVSSNISYLGGVKQANTNSSELKRVQAVIDPYESKIKIYYDGEFKSEATVSNFDFSNFFVRIQSFLYGKTATEFISYVDNVKFYENSSLDENYAIKVADYQKNGESVSDLHSGTGKLAINIENLTNKNSELTLIASKYTDKRLTDVLTYKNIEISSDSTTASVDINTGNCTDNDILKVMIWETQKPIYNYDIFVKDIVFKPFADEIIADFNRYNTKNTDVHPRIVADDKDFERIKEYLKSDITMQKWYADIISEANKLSKYDMDTNIRYYKYDGIRLLPICKNALDWLMVLGMANYFEPNAAYVQKAVEILDNVCLEFPDWNDETHFLDTGVMAQAVAVGYDWFYNDLSETQKENYETAMIEKGIKKGLKQYGQGAWWINTDSNWNPECNGGLMMSAMAIFDDYPEISSKMLEYGIDNLQYCIDATYPDGGWFEGPTYGLGTMHSLALVVDSLNSTFGDDYGLTKILGFDKVGDFLAQIEGPCGINNYSDADAVQINNEVVLWLANNFNDYENALLQLERQEKGTPLTMLWYTDEFLKAQSIVRENDAYFGGVEAVTMREDWNDSDSLWLSFCGGLSRDTHSHLDCGAFVLDWGGYRWASDLGADDYNLTNYYYDAYRTRAEGHNTLVINPDADGGQISGTAVVSEKSLNVDNPYAIVNLSSVYDSADALSVKRGFKLMDNRNSVFIRDEIELTKESDIYWFMHSAAELTLQTDNSVLMSNSDKSMLLEFVTDAENYDISIVDAEPMKTSPTLDGQKTNDNYKKIQIHMKDSDSVNLTVRITPIDGANHTPLNQISIYDLENWGDLN